MPGIAKCIYLDPDIYERFKQVVYARGGKVGPEINEFMKRRIAELEGEAAPTFNLAEYRLLKRRYGKLAKEVDNLKKRLTKRKAYELLRNLVNKLGLDFDNYSNIGEVAHSLREEWDGSTTDLNEFITLLETAGEKRQFERRLEEIRFAKTARGELLERINEETE